MGFHLTAGTLNQAALARRRGAQAAAAWLVAAAAFLLWLLASPLDDPLLAVEAGYCATTGAAGRRAVGHRARRISFLRIRSDGRALPLGSTRPESQRGRRCPGARHW